MLIYLFFDSIVCEDNSKVRIYNCLHSWQLHVYRLYNNTWTKNMQNVERLKFTLVIVCLPIVNCIKLQHTENMRHAQTQLDDTGNAGSVWRIFAIIQYLIIFCRTPDIQISPIYTKLSIFHLLKFHLKHIESWIIK